MSTTSIWSSDVCRRADLEPLVDRALKEGDGSLVILDRRGSEDVFSLHGICTACGIGLESLDPRLFSFQQQAGCLR